MIATPYMRASANSFGSEPCIKGRPVEMPARSESAAHEILNRERRPTPEAQVTVAGAMAVVVKAIFVVIVLDALFSILFEKVGL